MTARPRLSTAALLLLAALAAPAGSQEKPPEQALPPLQKGELVEKVACAADPTQAYALYVPRSYVPSRRWPLLFVFDARGRARIAAERFVAGAERYGYLVVSSHNTASDGPIEPNVAAMQALWQETHRRFSIDDRRVYAAGFSGTVRSSILLARAAPGTLAGIVGAGAGFPFEYQPDEKVAFGFFGTVGDLDFNYDEMMELDARLGELGLPYRIEVFHGPHAWMPEELATLALEWLEVEAMRTGRREKDPALIDALWARNVAAAKALEAAGKPYEAHRRWAALAREFQGLRDVTEAAAAAARLGQAPAVKERDREIMEGVQRDKKYLANAQRALSATPEGGLPPLGRVLGELRLKDLKTKAANRETEEGRSAQRLLNSLFSQTYFYLPRRLTERKEHSRAAFYLAVAAEIRPEEPEVRYELAAAHARAGSKKKALEELRRAVDGGFADAARLEAEEAFAPLRAEAAFRELVESARRRSAAAAPGAPR